jgi:PAS domain S-box-containing protein
MHKSASNTNTLFPTASEGLLVDALFTSIGDGAVATDQFGKITRINSTALEILGFEEKETIGKWFPSVIISVTESGMPINPMERPMSQAFLTGRSVFDKGYYQHKDGHIIPVAVTVSPIILKGRPVGAINLFRDITEEYEIDRMKSEFISLASHQLRTPLSSIKTYAHMLLEGYMGTITPKQRKALRTIIGATNHMNQLNNTLLNITRIESGIITVTKKVVSINNLVEKVVKDQSLMAAEKNIKIGFKASKKRLASCTDSFIVKEILNNLISNAIKYTPEKGEVNVDLHTEKKDIICSITDTGIGIPEQSQALVFSKFFRATNVLNRDTTGTGLGLYLVKRLAEQLGAKVWFESEVDKGSTFYLALPLETKVLVRS